MKTDNSTKAAPAPEKGVSKATIAQRLLAFIHGLDSEFPLSGGESESEFRHNASGIANGLASRIQGIDANFPLSGGN